MNSIDGGSMGAVIGMTINEHRGSPASAASRAQSEAAARRTRGGEDGALDVAAPPRNMCSVRRRPVPSAGSVGGRVSRVSALARTRRRRTLSAMGQELVDGFDELAGATSSPAAAGQPQAFGEVGGDRQVGHGDPRRGNFADLAVDGDGVVGGQDRVTDGDGAGGFVDGTGTRHHTPHRVTCRGRRRQRCGSYRRA